MTALDLAALIVGVAVVMGGAWVLLDLFAPTIAQTPGRWVWHHWMLWLSRPLTGTYTALDVLKRVRTVARWDKNAIDMGTWGSTAQKRVEALLDSHRYDGLSPEDAEAKLAKTWGIQPACGTVACLSGWSAIVMGETVKEGVADSVYNFVPSALGLTDDQRRHLFLPDSLISGSKSRIDIGAKKHKAAVLEHLDAFIAANRHQLEHTIIKDGVRVQSYQEYLDAQKPTPAQTGCSA